MNVLALPVVATFSFLTALLFGLGRPAPARCSPRSGAAADRGCVRAVRQLLGTAGGPMVTETVSLHALFGYNLLVVSAVLGLRVLAAIFRRS
jgi:hypothetical protein